MQAKPTKPSKICAGASRGQSVLGFFVVFFSLDAFPCAVIMPVSSWAGTYGRQ